MKLFKNLSQTSRVFYAFLFGTILTMIVGAPQYALAGGAILGALQVAEIKFHFLPTGVPFISLISGEPITFYPKQAKEVILDPAFERPSMEELVTVVQDIVAEEQIAFGLRLEKITKTDAGCGTGKSDKEFEFEESSWLPKKVKFWLHQCADDLERTWYVWGLKPGIERYDLTVGEFATYAMEILTEAVASDFFRMGWFSSLTVDDFASGGTLLNASDIPNYNQINGLFPQLFAVPAMKKYSITENAGASFVDQLNLAADAAIKIFRGLLVGCDTRLKQRKDKRFYVTQTIMDNWLTYKETQNLDRSFERQDKDFMTDVYRGITIIAVTEWDRWIQADFQNGVTYYRPHRVLLTTKDNLQVGVDAKSATSKFKIYFDEESEETNFKGGWKMDTHVMRPYLTALAY